MPVGPGNVVRSGAKSVKIGINPLIICDFWVGFHYAFIVSALTFYSFHPKRLSMKKQLNLLFLFLFFVLSGLPAQEFEQTKSVFFATASADIDASAEAALTDLAEWMSSLNDYELVVEAYTDSRGTVEYNEQLAQDRAQSVVDWLANAGITTDRLDLRSFGERKAGQDLHSEEALQNNRRVDVWVQAYQWEDLTTLWDHLRTSQAQSFTIDPGEDQLIEGEKGGRFLIRAGSLVDAQGMPVDGPVEIRLVECYTFSDMLAYGLSTHTSSAILETGGMFEITAYANGEALALSEGKQVSVAVPTVNFQEDMSLFYGEGHNELGGADRWQGTGQAMQEQPVLDLPEPPKRPKWRAYFDEYFEDYTFEEEEPVKQPELLEIKQVYRPRKPNPENIQYYPRGWEKVFMNKEKREAKRQELIAQKQAAYEKGMAHYEERLLDNERRAEVNAQRLEQYELDVEAWQDRRAVALAAHRSSGPYLRAKSHYDSIHAVRLNRYEAAREQYMTLREERVGAFLEKAEAQHGLSENTVSQYFFAINRMGWANVDRFMKGELARSPLWVKDAEVDVEAMVFLVFPERSIILRVPSRGAASGLYHLSAAPVGERAHVFGIKVVDQKAYLASQEVVVSENNEIELAYEPGRLRDIKEAFRSLD